jgi:hypothetical protein
LASRGERFPALRYMPECRRSHGLPTWSDRTLDSEGRRPGFDLLHVQGFNPNSSQTSHVMRGYYDVMPEANQFP